jgi:hypothetical protein
VSLVGARRQLRSPLISRARPAPSPPAMMCERRHGGTPTRTPEASVSTGCSGEQVQGDRARHPGLSTTATAKLGFGLPVGGSADRWLQLP